MPSLPRRALLRSLSATGLALLAGCASNDDGSEPMTTKSVSREPTEPTMEATTEAKEEATTEPTEKTSSSSLGGGPGPLPQESWPLSLRSASNCPLLPDGPTFSGEARENWRVEPTAPPEEDPFALEFSGPVVTDGQVIAANRLLFTTNREAPDTQLVRAFDADTGEQTWKYTIGSESNPAARDLPTTPAVWDDVVLVGHGQTVHAVDMEVGTESWRRSLGTKVHAIVPTGPLAYVRAHRSIIVLHHDGSSAWTTPVEDFPYTLAVGHRHLYASVSRRILALDPEDGEELWRVEIPPVEGGYAVSRLVAVEGGIIAIQNSGDIWAFDEDAERRWRSDTRYDSFVTDGMRVYARSAGTLQALAVPTGEQLWELTCSDLPNCDGTTEFGPSVLNGDSLVITLDDGGLLGVTPADGTPRWSLNDVPPFEHLALDPNALYGVGDDGILLSRIVAST